VEYVIIDQPCSGHIVRSQVTEGNDVIVIVYHTMAMVNTAQLKALFYGSSSAAWNMIKNKLILVANRHRLVVLLAEKLVVVAPNP
jgi:hypothetical protein